MKKNLVLIFIMTASIILAFFKFTYDIFISIGFFTVFLTSVYGFFAYDPIWYHKSAHIIISSMIGFLIGTYELFKYLSSFLSTVVDPSVLPSADLWTVFFGILCFLVMIYEVSVLKKSK